MKKYDIFDLFVVVCGKKYFICRYSIISNKYKEILKNEKINKDSITFIEPLSNCSSILGIMDYKTGKHLELTKAEILNFYIELNEYDPYKKMAKLKLSKEDSYKSAIKFYLLATKLKYKIRSGWDSKHWNINSNRLESIAEHVYGTCILAIAMNSEFNFNIDINRVLKMLTIHEIGEVLIGDITPYDNVTPEQKLEMEHKAMEEILGDLSDKEELFDLLLEFDEGKTEDAKFAYWCDKLEANIQSKVYQDSGMQRALDDQKDNVVFSNPKIKSLIESGLKTPFDIWYQSDKNKFKDSKEFTKVLKYVKDNNLNI